MIDQELLKEVTKFLLENPKPSDKQLHEWAKSKELDVHEVEATMYELAGTFVKEFLNAGLSAKHITKVKNIDPKQLQAGIEVEMEHTTSRFIAAKIARDHCIENSKYYLPYLKDMEDLAIKNGDQKP